MNKLTTEQAIIITGFTGVLSCRFSDFNDDVMRRIKDRERCQGVENIDWTESVKDLYRDDFMKITPEDLTP